jgi:Uma2 family endonuclease
MAAPKKRSSAPGRLKTTVAGKGAFVGNREDPWNEEVLGVWMMTTTDAVMNFEELRDVLRRMAPPFLIRKYEATPEDYEGITDEDVRCEYLDGVLIMHSPATLRHEERISFLDFLLSGFVTDRSAEKIFCSNAVMQMGERRFCPDLSYLATAHFGRMQGGRVMGPVDLAVEVLSDSTRDYDRNEKRRAYREGEVPEIWLIDLDHRCFEVEWYVPREGYSTEILTRGRWKSRVLSGFWVDVEWCWAEPLPNRIECLRELMVRGKDESRR